VLHCTQLLSSGTKPDIFMRTRKAHICIMPENLQKRCMCPSQPTQPTVISVFNSISESGELLSPEPLPGTATKPTMPLKHQSGRVTPLSSAHGSQSHMHEKLKPEVK